MTGCVSRHLLGRQRTVSIAGADPKFIHCWKWLELSSLGASRCPDLELWVNKVFPTHLFSNPVPSQRSISNVGYLPFPLQTSSRPLVCHELH